MTKSELRRMYTEWVRQASVYPASAEYMAYSMISMVLDSDIHTIWGMISQIEAYRDNDLILLEKSSYSPDRLERENGLHYYGRCVELFDGALAILRKIAIRAAIEASDILEYNGFNVQK